MPQTLEDTENIIKDKRHIKIVMINSDGTKRLRIPSRYKVRAPTFPLDENDTIIFGGTFSYIYTQQIFLNQITYLFKHFFGLTLLPELVTIKNQYNNTIEYLIDNHYISQYEMEYINKELTNVRCSREEDYYPTKELLFDEIDKTYNDHKSLILISRQINKDKRGELKCVNEYTYYEKRDIQKLLKQMESNNHLFEVIEKKYEVKPYFDLEIEYENEESINKTHEEKLKLFIEFLKSEIQLIYEIPLDDSDIVVLDSCTSTKLSYHIVINNKIKFENVVKHKEFTTYLVLRMKNPMNEEEKELFNIFKWVFKGKKSDDIRYIVDDSVYTDFRCFRLVNQSKKNKIQKLKLISNHEMIDTFIQYDASTEIKMYLETDKLSRYFIEELEEVSKNKVRERRAIRELKTKKDKNGNEMKESFDFHINFKKEGLTLQIRKNMSDIDLMKIEPEHYKYLHTLPIQDNYEEWIKIGMALKTCGAPINYWDEWSKLGSKYRKGECNEKYDTFMGGENNTHGYGIRTLKYLANKCKPDLFKGFNPIYNLMYKLDLDGIEKVVEDSHYLSQQGTKHENNIFTDKQLLIMHASMGGGKTTSIVRMLKKYGYESCLFFSTRQTFAHFASGEFKEFYNYLLKDEEDINQKKKIIISLESLYKIDKFKKYDMIVCDEIETLLTNFSSPTLGTRTYEIFNIFVSLLRNASKVVMMDAFISNRTIHLGRDLMGIKNMRYLVNVAERKMVPARKMIYKRDDSFPMILENILKGKKLYIMFSSNKKLNEFVEYLNMKKDNNTLLNDDYLNKILIYNRDTDKDTMLGLMNINQTWKEASCIIASPKITVGCSYNPEGDKENPSFDMKINMAVHSCTARDTFQSLMRVRNIKDDGLLFALGPSVYTNFEKNFLSLNLFNDYENEKRENIINELRKRVEERQKNNDVYGREDKCTDLKTLIDYLEENKPIKELREILYYNSLEINMSSRYFSEYYMALLPQAGFKYIEEETKEEKEEVEVHEKIVFEKKGDTELIKEYEQIPDISSIEVKELEAKQRKNNTSKEENNMINKYYYELLIDSDKTPKEALAKMFFDIWLDRTKKKIILHNYHYSKSFITLLQKELQDTLCTEKVDNLAQKQEVLKEIEEILDVNHGNEEKAIPIEKIKECYEYLRKNHEYINDKVFKIRDRSKNKDEELEEDQKTKYVLTFLNKIYKNFYGYNLKIKEIDSHSKYPLSYHFYPTDNFKYSYIRIPEDRIPVKYMFEDEELMESVVGKLVKKDEKVEEKEEVIKEVKETRKVTTINMDIENETKPEITTYFPVIKENKEKDKPKKGRRSKKGEENENNKNGRIL